MAAKSNKSLQISIALLGINPQGMCILVEKFNLNSRRKTPLVKHLTVGDFLESDPFPGMAVCTSIGNLYLWLWTIGILILFGAGRVESGSFQSLTDAPTPS